MNLRDRLALLSKQGGARVGETAPSTTERLQRLLEYSAGRKAARRNLDGDVAMLLGGCAIAHGVVLVEQFFFPDHVHGAEPLAALFEGPLHVFNGDEPVEPQGLLFLDTETTGLAGGTGTLPFVLGLARPEPEGLRVRQYFLTGFQGEAAMLDHARSWFDAASHLVTFNGKCFDVPLLATRFRLMKLTEPFAAKGHLDLLHPTRTAFASRWPDCRLQTAEQRLLGFVRANDLGGHLVPAVWSAFLRFGHLDDVPRVMEHNRWDLVSLAGLLSRLSAVFAGSFHADVDALSVARHRLRRGDEAGALRELADHASSLGVEGRLELARLHRRRREWDQAVPMWELLAVEGVAEALERLAKYHEHVRRDFSAALAMTEQLLTLRSDDATHLRRRQRILARKSATSAVDTILP